MPVELGKEGAQERLLDRADVTPQREKSLFGFFWLSSLKYQILFGVQSFCVNPQVKGSHHS